VSARGSGLPPAGGAGSQCIHHRGPFSVSQIVPSDLGRSRTHCGASRATITAAGTLDYDQGLGPYGGWVEYRFEDGSTKLARLEGEVTERLPDGGNLQEGTFTYVASTDRFEGIQGSGTFRGSGERTVSSTTTFSETRGAR